jgi:hypothetical protein
VFPFRLASWLPTSYASSLHWLKSLLVRLGRDCALRVWEDACRNYDEKLLRQILQAKWHDAEPEEAGTAEKTIAALGPQFFPAAIEGVSEKNATQLVGQQPLLSRIRQTFPSPHVWREMTAYEAIHLKLEMAALLAESLLRFHGKQGELIAYEILRAERSRTTEETTGSAAAFMHNFRLALKEGLFAAGLELEIVRVTEQELVLHVTECAWARYFQEQHPQVGYLTACSTDETAFRASHNNLRMQRTSTLMEGGKVCDFRIYQQTDHCRD